MIRPMTSAVVSPSSLLTLMKRRRRPRIRSAKKGAESTYEVQGMQQKRTDYSHTFVPANMEIRVGRMT